jgi:hypothetical protein
MTTTSNQITQERHAIAHVPFPVVYPHLFCTNPASFNTRLPPNQSTDCPFSNLSNSSLMIFKSFLKSERLGPPCIDMSV